jgi:hypothetical protein
MIEESESNDSRSSAESSEGFTFASAMDLRKNLTEAFDKQVRFKSTSSSKSSIESSLSEGLSVSDRINQYEKVTDVHHHRQYQSVSRPPMIPSRNKQSNNNPIPSDRFAVYLRIRPPALYQNDKKKLPVTNTIEILPPKNPQMNPTTVRTYAPADSNASKSNLNRDVYGPTSCAKEFEFHQVLAPETTQQDLYSVVAAPLIQSLFAENKPNATKQKARSRNDLKSALLFSYGITNAGKTHTILGDTKSNNNSKWGVIPRAIADVFDQMKLHPKRKVESQLYISCFEVYNEQIFDLLPKKSSTTRIGPPPVLKVRESRGQILVRGLAKHKVTNVNYGVELTHTANSRRHTSSNNLNSGSSRSHFICQMQIISSSKQTDAKSSVSRNGYTTDEEAAWAQTKDISTIWIVDLAGSERSKRTGMGSSRQKEASLINKSLLTLMRCLTVMRESGRYGSSNVIPFRESRLTHLFMRHLTGSSASQTAMLVNANPSIADFDETQHVLGYASKAKTIKLKPEEVNKKRKHHFGDEYDMNGRKKLRAVTKNVGNKLLSKAGLSPRKIARKFSPKKFFSGSVKNLSNSGVNKQKNFQNGVRNHLQESMSSNLIAEMTAKEEQIKCLQKTLSRAKIEIESRKMENTTLLEDLQNQERQIRMEVSEEIEERFRLTRARNNEEIERLKSKLGSNSSLCLSTNKVQIDSTESHIQDLMDKVEECEEEMVRLRQEHTDEVAALKSQIKKLVTENNGGDKDGPSLKRIEQLEKELSDSRKRVLRLEQSKKELIENYESLLQEDEDEDEMESDAENISPVPRKGLIGVKGPSNRSPLGLVTGNIPAMAAINLGFGAGANKREAAVNKGRNAQREHRKPLRQMRI